MTDERNRNLTPFENAIEGSHYMFILRRPIVHGEWSWGIYNPHLGTLVIWDFPAFMGEAVYDSDRSCLMIYYD